jgi:chitin synthase
MQSNISDLIQVSNDSTTEDIVEILRQRYLHDLIYTAISPSLLIALNPYKNVNHESSKADYLLEYKDTQSAKANKWRDPHLYQLVNHAYLHMRRTRINQSIVFR